LGFISVLIASNRFAKTILLGEAARFSQVSFFKVRICLKRNSIAMESLVEIPAILQA
jgi:hypothetical protein